MITSGIINPIQVTRNAIVNAASIAALMITSEAAVVEIKEDRNRTHDTSDLLIGYMEWPTYSFFLWKIGHDDIIEHEVISFASFA